eukprot:scaffold55792_cov34-Phaeocystis_antarctica.AAC.1
MLAQRHARGRNGLPLGRRSCDGAGATSSVSTVATLALRSQESRPQVQSLHEVPSAAVPPFLGRHRPMTVGRMQITLGEHGGPGKTRQDSSSLGSAARRLTLSRYVARLKPRCRSLALSVRCGTCQAPS